MATVVLSNHKFPEDGQVSIPLPIPPEEYEHCMEMLEVLCIGHASLTHRARSVYMYLRDRSDGQGKCWPGIKTIASDLNISRSTAKRALIELERHGYIDKQARFRDNGSSTSNLYTIR